MFLVVRMGTPWPENTCSPTILYTSPFSSFLHCHLQPRHAITHTPPSPPLLSLQLLRKINFTTSKAYAMFRPGDMQVTKTAEPNAAPAVVSEKHNLGWTIKYMLRFDDDVVGGLWGSPWRVWKVVWSGVS